MFTGLVESTARIVSKTSNQLVVDLGNHVYTQKDNGFVRGDSISVNGTCLTVIKKESKTLTFDVSHESLSVTNLAKLSTNDEVNIEKSIPADGRFHGHFVMGHIDTVGRVYSLTKQGEYVDLVIEFNADYKKYVTSKGSVAINGVSLTINEVLSDDKFRLTLIPHTLKMTNLLSLKKGDAVNIEFDILAKYIQNMLNGDTKTESNITEGYLREHGYVK